MPIYEYACPHCRKTFEEWLKSDDKSSTHPCPACGALAARVISQTSFILKGGGWYVTEYGSHHTDSDDTAPASDNTSPAATSDAKTDGGKTAEGASPAKPAVEAPSKAEPSTPKAAPQPSPTATASSTAPAAGA